MARKDVSTAQQLSACLSKNFTQKKRNPGVTCLEFLSPVVLILVLVAGYSLSTVSHHPAALYSTLHVTIPPSFVQSIVNQKSGAEVSFWEIYDFIHVILQEPIPIPTFDEYVYVAKYVSSQVDQKTYNLLMETSEGEIYGNILRMGSLHFAPDTTHTRALIDYLNTTTSTFHTLSVHLHKDASEGANYVLNHLDERTWALITLNEVEEGHVDYTIRMNYSTLPNTNLIINYVNIGLDTTYERYIVSGFLTLQRTIDAWAFSSTGASATSANANPDAQTCSPAQPFLIPFPTASYDLNIFYSAVGFLLGLFMTMATLFPMSRLVKSVVEEKESRVRECMLIMGLREDVLHLSWFITATTTFLWIAFSISAVCSLSFLPRSSPSLIFVYFFVFCMSEVTFSFFISTFFSRAKLAAIMGPIALFVGLLPRFIFYSTNSYEDTSKKFWASLLSPTAFAFGADIIASYEYAELGVTWSNMHEGGYSFFDSIALMLFDFFLYGFMAWYLDQVLPTQWGVPKHPLFFFMPSYWTTCCTRRRSRALQMNEAFYDAEDPREDAADRPVVEPVGSDMKLCVTVRNLVKQYGDGKVAVNDLSLNMYEDQITCLLGHNGAGKSTFISILTGLISATSGSCKIYGNDLAEDLSAIRRETGICPQYNVLFTSLTVKEHLAFFAKLKGLTGSDRETAVMNMLRDVGLTEKANTPEHALSGGMKRKLSVGIALIGSPKFVLLDEPTSGMDPYSRRATWELLRRSKQGRVCVLTTHFMDEADILGDRIAIISSGALKCCGSSLFLKSNFGGGYNLTLAHSKANTELITQYVCSYLPGAKCVNASSGEITFSCSLDSCDKFAKLFRNLDSHKTTVGVESYGVSICTLEQVFLTFAIKDAEKSTFESDQDAFVTMVRGRAIKYPSPVRQLYLLWWCTARGTNPKVFGELWRWSRKIEMTPESGLHVAHINEIELPVLGETKLSQPFETRNTPQVRGTGEVNFEDGTSPLLKDKPLVQDAVETNKSETFSETQIDICAPNGSKILPRLSSSFQATTIAQVAELLNKRFLTMRRDFKGFVFQIFVPALVIVLVLLILTINYSPAGPSILLQAKLMPVKNEVIVGRVQPAPYSSTNITEVLTELFPSSNIKLTDTSFNTSHETSVFMLDTIKSHTEYERYGSYVFDDKIAVNLTVIWPWIQKEIDQLVPYLLSYGTNKLPHGFYFSDLVIFPAINFNFTEVRRIIDDVLTNTTVNVTLVNQILDSVFVNQSFSQASLKLQQITYAEVVVYPSAKVASFQDLQVTVSNVSYHLGDVNVSYSRILQFLPKTTQTYSFEIPSTYSILHNASSPHAIAAFRGELIAANFASCFTETYETYFKVRNDPLPLTALQTIEVQAILALFASLFVLIPLCYIPAAFVIFVVRERTCKSKHLQSVSGVSMTAYWISTYLWDSFLFLILDGIVMVAFLCFNQKDTLVFVGTAESGWTTFLLLFLYGQSILPLSYLYSFAFENHSTAQISIMGLNFLTGFIFVMAYYITTSIPKTAQLGQQLVHFFRFFPPFNIGIGFINLSTTYFVNSVFGQHKSLFEWEVCGRCLVFMLVEAAGYFLCVCLSEHPYVKVAAFQLEKLRISAHPPVKSTDTFENEVDVAAEAARVQSLHPSECVLRMNLIEKVYPAALFTSGATAKIAVKGVSLGLSRGECFGYLGINGAGKTTTLSILTGDILPTSGDASIGGIDIQNPRVRSLMGYCPQVDPIIDQMTGRETLTMFAKLRGIKRTNVADSVNRVLNQVSLARYADTPCGYYSGGNKRKLSLGVALIGDPPLLLLDEPSTGMDPYARRQMWNVIADIARERTVILTTHSMEEAEALCHRIGIMVGGQLRCLGTPQHLKDKYGAGYQVEVRCDTYTQEHTEEVQNYIEHTILGEYPHKLEERHGGFMKWHVFGTVPISLADVFGKMEEAKQQLRVVHYSISQCTLEHVFIRFAKEQQDEKGRIEGIVY